MVTSRILGCPKIDEKKWGNHDWRPSMNGTDTCTKCGATRPSEKRSGGRTE